MSLKLSERLPNGEAITELNKRIKKQAKQIRKLAKRERELLAMLAR